MLRSPRSQNEFLSFAEHVYAITGGSTTYCLLLTTYCYPLATVQIEKFGRLGELRDGNYYVLFRSYSMPDGMTHFGAQGDIFDHHEACVASSR